MIFIKIILYLLSFINFYYTLIKLEKEIEKRKYNKPVIIIHNLKTYTTVKQVLEYIENTLLKSASFSLEKSIDLRTSLKRDNFFFTKKM